MSLTMSIWSTTVPAFGWRKMTSTPKSWPALLAPASAIDQNSAVQLVLASQPYEETDYIRDYEQFRAGSGR